MKYWRNRLQVVISQYDKEVRVEEYVDAGFKCSYKTVYTAKAKGEEGLEEAKAWIDENSI